MEALTWYARAWISRPLGWLMVPVVVLIGLALLLGVTLIVLPAVLAWYGGLMPRGIPTGTIAAFGIAIVIAGLTTRRRRW